MSELRDQRLQGLFDACFDRRSDIASEARHLAGFFLEYRLLRYSKEQEEQYAAELKENDSFQAEYGNLELYSGEFEHSEIAIFGKKLLKEFLSRPEQRFALARVLKQAGAIEGVQKAIADFVQRNWRSDELSTDRALDVIWSIEVLSSLTETLREIVNCATNGALREHASQLLELLKSVE